MFSCSSGTRNAPRDTNKRLVVSHFRQRDLEPAGSDRGIILYRAMLGYFGSVVLKEGLGALASEMPALAQPLLALVLIKFVFIYLIAARVFKTQRGYACLLVISSVEMVTGLTGYSRGTKKHSSLC